MSTDTLTLREATSQARALMRHEVSSTRAAVAVAVGKLKKAIEDGAPVNGLRTAMEAALQRLEEAEGILQRTEAEHFRGDS